jgi:hypothetical protein
VQLLRDSDAMSMRHSLEVRTPLVDRELLRRAAMVPPRLRRAGPAKLSAPPSQRVAHDMEVLAPRLDGSWLEREVAAEREVDLFPMEGAGDRGALYEEPRRRQVERSAV